MMPPIRRIVFDRAMLQSSESNSVKSATTISRVAIDECFKIYRGMFASNVDDSGDLNGHQLSTCVPLPLDELVDSLSPDEHIYVERQNELFAKENTGRSLTITLIVDILKPVLLTVFICLSIKIFWWTKAAYLDDPTVVNSYKFAAVISYIATISGGIIWIILSLVLGRYEAWIKKNIDPYTARLKNWLNRRNR